MVILAVGPHPDDVEIGCFGTLARLVRNELVVILILTSGAVGGSPSQREEEAQESARLIGASLELLRYPDGSLVQNAETVAAVRSRIVDHKATTVFAPFPDDTHQDHWAANRIVTASAAHTSEILLYETPSTVGFRPTVFYDITSTLSVKKKAIALFASQAGRPYLEEDLIDGQARHWALRLHQKGKAFEGFGLFRSVR